MSDTCIQTPFWQRQPRLPIEIHRFLQDRMEAALQDATERQVLVWPTILGAPGLRKAHPDGLPEEALLNHAARMLGALAVDDPAAAWRRHRLAWPETAEGGPEGWRPASLWGAWGPLVSLRSGWRLAALTPLPLDECYPLACGVSLFNHGLYHECHDALEPLWSTAESELKHALQGLILLAGGYHHLQQHQLAGMNSLWAEAIQRLAPSGGRISTPWGEVRASVALDLTIQRLEHGKRRTDDAEEDAIFGPLWALDRPIWELA